jgi:hypothetical protein
MPLIKYTQFLTFPDGNPVDTMPYPVMRLGGNVLTPTYVDKAGTTPLVNPVLTDSDGMLTFYAAPGAYVTDVSGRLFQYVVDDDETDAAWPGTFIHTQASPATVWTIGHHFGIEPTVTVLVDAQDSQGDVSHPDDETTTITFGAPITGTAYLRG